MEVENGSRGLVIKMLLPHKQDSLMLISMGTNNRREPVKKTLHKPFRNGTRLAYSKTSYS
jgi:hypothetical protein